jgi:hypothetical protein
MYSDKLKKYLQDNPERQVVYMNDAGGWLLHQRVEFPKEVTREEILNIKPVKETPAEPEPETETETKSSTKKPSKK